MDTKLPNVVSVGTHSRDSASLRARNVIEVACAWAQSMTSLHKHPAARYLGQLLSNRGRFVTVL